MPGSSPRERRGSERITHSSVQDPAPGSAAAHAILHSNVSEAQRATLEP